MLRIAIASSEQSIASEVRKILLKVPDYHVIWLAYNSEQTIEKCAHDKPDLLIIDVAILKLKGALTTERVMKNSPCAILALTSNPTKDLSLVFDAMGKGAIDVIGITSKNCSSNADIETVLKKVKMVGAYLGKEGHKPQNHTKNAHKFPPLLLIGASTGGPIAIAKILAGLPQNTPIAIVIVQHIDEEFAGGFGRWLQSQVTFPVELVKEGSVPEIGKILVAGKNLHLVMTKNLELSYLPEVMPTPYCPSIDLFFESVATHWNKPFAALLLTGMGHDGAKGLKHLRNSGWHTIVQNKESSVIFGMPKAAIEADAASEILDLQTISDKILKLLSKVV